MKAIWAILLVMVGYISGVSQNVVKDHGHLRVDGTQLKDEHGNAIVLRGLSYGWHNWWPRFYNKETVKWVGKEWGCTMVRAAMGVEPYKGYIKDPKWSEEKITAVIDGAIEADLYVIIDWHSHNVNRKEAKKFFIDMATRYGEYPNVIYEIFNEPDHESWEEVKAYSEEIIKTIRAIDPDNIILVGSPHWDQDVHLVADNPITGYENIMYTLHFYAASHGQGLRDRGNYALSKGIPLFISESAGMEANGKGPLNMNEWTQWIAWMEKNKLSWITWSIADKDETCSMLLPSASSEGGWTDDQLKESGIKTREFLRSFAK